MNDVPMVDSGTLRSGNCSRRSVDVDHARVAGHLVQLTLQNGLVGREDADVKRLKDVRRVRRKCDSVHAVLTQEGEDLKLNVATIVIKNDSHVLAFRAQVRRLFNELFRPRKEDCTIHAGRVAMIHVGLRKKIVYSLDRAVCEAPEVWLLAREHNDGSVGLLLR